MRTENVLKLIEIVRLNSPCWETFSTTQECLEEEETLNDYQHSEYVDFGEDGIYPLYGSYLVAYSNYMDAIKRIETIFNKIEANEKCLYNSFKAVNISNNRKFNYAIIMQIGMFADETF